MELLIFQIKCCCYLTMVLKGFKSLTSAWHLEYFKIPLSKKKYLCNQKCRELKTTQRDNQPNKNQPNKNTQSQKNPHSHLLFWRTHFLLLFFFIFIFAVTTHPVSHIQTASGFQTDIPLLPCASPSKAISSFSASSLPASVVPGYNSLLPGVLPQFPSCPA